MTKPKDIAGKRFGRLVAKYRTEEKSPGGSYIWKCDCDCGGVKFTAIAYLMKGSTNSCGCLADEQLNKLIETSGGARHPYKGTLVYSSWSSMLTRARSTTLKNYEDVSVCARWDPRQGGSFLNFLDDMGLPGNGESLNRTRGSKVYSKDTCEWANRSLQGYDQKKSVRNKTGRIGVYQKQDGKFRAKITKDGKYIFLGDFSSFEAACEARTKAEIEYFGFSKE